MILLVLMISYKSSLLLLDRPVPACVLQAHTAAMPMYQPGRAGEAPAALPPLEREGDQEERDHDCTGAREKTGCPSGCWRAGKIDKEAVSSELKNLTEEKGRPEGWPMSMCLNLVESRNRCRERLSLADRHCRNR